MEQYCLNEITLTGCLASAPVYSHSNHGRQFYSFFLEARRLSGTLDRLPILASGELLSSVTPEEGECLQITGQIRSHNSRALTGRRLILSVFARSLQVGPGPHDNRVVLTGTVCKEPVYRRTPLGREICDVMLAVNRTYGRADYLPCILWGRSALEAASCPVGTLLTLEGRMQSRPYIKIVEELPQQRVAYEISATEVLFPEKE